MEISRTKGTCNSILCFLFILIIFSFPVRSSAQVTDSTLHMRKMERFEYVAGAGLAFSLLDYVGYSLVRRDNGAPVWYRLLEGTVQTGLSYFLYKTCGLSSTIAFNLIWWTWGLDLAWYGWSYLLNPASNGHWENRTWSGLHLHAINWAGWTPIGLLRPRGSYIARDALYWQSIVGFSIAITIL